MERKGGEKDGQKPFLYHVVRVILHTFLLLFVCCVFFTFTLQEEEKKGPDDSAVITDAEFFRYISFLFKFQINFFFLFYLSQRQAFSFSQRHVIDQIYILYQNLSKIQSQENVTRQKGVITCVCVGDSIQTISLGKIRWTE